MSWCLIHDWPKWSEPKVKAAAERINGGPWKERPIMYQDRTCKRCGQYEVRRVTIE